MIAMSFLKCFILSNTLTTALSGWIYAHYTLPNADKDMAAGTYNDSIFIVAGANYSRQVTEWNSITQNFTYYGMNYLDIAIKGHAEAAGAGQYWTQKDEILYLLTYEYDYNVYNIYTFNMKSKAFITDPITTQSLGNVSIDTTTCLVSTHDYLFGVAGGGHLQSGGTNSLYILNFTSNVWLQNTPSLNLARYFHACTVHNGYIWAFAGHPHPFTMTNERIAIDNILQNEWQYVDPLTTSQKYPRAVAFEGYIYIISQKNLYIMDANTGVVMLSNDTVPYRTLWETIVIFDRSIHLFGGASDGIPFDTWIYYPLYGTSFNTTSADMFGSTSTINAVTNVPSTTSLTHGAVNISFTQTSVKTIHIPSMKNNTFILVLLVSISAVLCVIVISFIVWCLLEKGKTNSKAYPMVYRSRTVSNSIIHDVDEDVNIVAVELPPQNDYAEKEKVVRNDTKGNIAEDEFEVIGEADTIGGMNVNDEGL